MISIVLPDDELRHRLDARLGDARVHIWARGAGSTAELAVGPIAPVYDAAG